MTDNMQAVINDGRKATELENNEIYQRAFETFEVQCFDLWKRTTDPIERNRLWEAINTAAQVKTIIGMIAANGRVAEKELETLLARQKAA